MIYLLLTSRSRQAADETFMQLKEQSEQLGLKINVDETNYLKCKKGKKDRDI
jgi:predicted amino acid-binding ACT domain protein